MEKRISSTENFVINAVEKDTVKINGKSVKDVTIVSLENSKGALTMFATPKQVAAGSHNFEALKGEVINLPTREQVAGVTGYIDDDKKEVVDEKSGIYPQPFVNYICGDFQKRRLESALATLDRRNIDLRFAKSISEEDNTYLKENDHLMSIFK